MEYNSATKRNEYGAHAPTWINPKPSCWKPITKDHLGEMSRSGKSNGTEGHWQMARVGGGGGGSGRWLTGMEYLCRGKGNDLKIAGSSGTTQ